VAVVADLRKSWLFTTGTRRVAALVPGVTLVVPLRGDVLVDGPGAGEEGAIGEEVAFRVDTTNGRVGNRIRQIRHARGKSLSVIAGLAGISTPYLSMIERGQRALDRRSLIVALADALEVAPSEIIGTAVATPGELEEDRSLNAVRLALLSVGMGEPRGEIQPVEALGQRATEILIAQRDCDYSLVGTKLPALIRDLHTTLDAKQMSATFCA
jgi:transcriptional regulator with XRE-family HTH domain